MKNKRQLQSEINSLKDLKTIIGAYQEIAAGRMRKVKRSVLQNRNFLGGLADLYQRVLYTYKVTTPSGRKSVSRKSHISLRRTNGKTVAVLVTANTGLYGDIIRKTFDLFMEGTANNSHDLVILGRVGKQMYDNVPNGRAYKYYDVSDASIVATNIKNILETLLEYANVVVYHGLYISILDQKSVTTFVTGQSVGTVSNTNLQELKCLIEPSIEEVLSFFEQQILSALFEQTLHESSLSKFASRMVSLDIANGNIASTLKKVKFMSLKEQHQRTNFEQMDRISGIALWK